MKISISKSKIARSITQTKTMLKPKQNRRQVIIRRLRSTPALLLMSSLVVGAALLSPLVRADQFDDQINALRQQNSVAQGALNGLAAQAASYQDTINQLQVQINAIQAAIAANVAQQTSLQNQITADQQQIDAEKLVLGNDVKTIYVNGQITPVEMLATSNSLSDYIDKQEAYSAIQDKIQTTVKEITALQAKLQAQKQEVETLLASQRTQNAQLSSAQAQQASMLAYNVDQQNAYNSQIANNSSKIADLRRQQIIANSRYNIGNFKGDPNNGGYPSVWANAPQDSMIDSWGMYNRECVSYTAFMVHQEYLEGRASHDMPWWGGVGNANQWDEDARRAGIPVDTNPTPGSIAISNAGTWGHAMYVEAVSGNTIYVQQFNADFTGHYSEGWRYTTGLVFLHF